MDDRIVTFCALADALDRALEHAHQLTSGIPAAHRAVDSIEDSMLDALYAWLAARVGVPAYTLRDIWPTVMDAGNLTAQAAALSVAVGKARVKRPQFDEC